MSGLFTATRSQVVTYFLTCLFSISFLVFLNSSVSFVITNLIGQSHGVGDAVGTLGFADELLALVACPLWGLLSDRVGVGYVCSLGYAIIGVALFVFVQAHNVYPQLLLARLLFSIGGAAVSTMVTAILPAMVAPAPSVGVGSNKSPRVTLSLSDEHTPTPILSRLREPSTSPQQTNMTAAETEPDASRSASSRLAGIVGLFTGFGALLALSIFLPLPAFFQKFGKRPGQAVADSYYCVASISIVVSIVCLFGLRNLHSEKGKGWSSLVKGNGPPRIGSQSAPKATKISILLEPVRLGFTSMLGLGYLGGFVARAASVGLSLFIPLSVNAYFIRSGQCDAIQHNPADLKKECGRAYTLAAELTGISQLAALIFAPVFGYLGSKVAIQSGPVIAAALAGIVGSVGFASIKNPDPNGVGGSPWIFVIVVLLGIGQIGAIVSSLGIVGQCVLATQATPSYLGWHARSGVDNTDGSGPQESTNDSIDSEGTPLLSAPQSRSASRQYLKGSIAGTYSLAGGVGILLLTKLGGWLFDVSSPAAPFYMLAVFNAVLLIAGIGFMASSWRDPSVAEPAEGAP